MHKYRVIQTIQGNLSDNSEPVEIVYSRSDDAATAIASMASLLAQGPDTRFFKTTSIRVDIAEPLGAPWER